MKRTLGLLVAVWALTLVATPLASVATGKDTSAGAALYRSQRSPGQTDHVIIHLETGGETKYADQGKPQREKMRVVCDLDYVEKTLETDPDGLGRSIRDYEKIAVEVKVGDGQFKPTLRPEHRLIAVEAAKQTALLFAPEGNLTRDELDAIDIQANSLLLDRLLPEKPVAVGDRWPHSEELMAAMLGLDEVAKTTVQSTLKDVTGTRALFEFTGQVEGAIYGVSTVVEVKGRYRFDLGTKRIDWLGMLIKEDRQTSFIADGVEATSRLEVLITPAKAPASLADAALATLQSTPELSRLTYESPDGNWQCEHDRRWYIHHQRPANPAAVLRLLDRGKLAGQCNLASLPDRDPSKLVSLSEFQEDVRRALDKSFGEFVEASESSNDAKYRIYRVVAQGTASDIAMRWIYYLVTDPRGRQAALTFAVEQSLIERFADIDKPLVQSLRFVEKETKDKKMETTDEHR